MYKRRDIREAAVQFLYFADLEAGPEASHMEDAFWEMTQEHSLRKLSQAKGKAILHVAQGRENRLLKLSKHSEPLLAQLKADNTSQKLITALNKVLTQESKMNAALDLLKTSQQNKHVDTSLAETSAHVMAANASLIRLRREFAEATQDFPQWKQALEPVTAAVTHLDRVSERLTAIDDPDSSVGDFAHIRSSSAEITSFRQETQHLVQGILNHKKTIDEALTQVIDNYTPERITPVDRAILRLATYEIKHSDDIPKAVSINEAVEIAKRFSTSESSRFINGVLDKI